MTLAKYVNAWLETSEKKEQNPPFPLINNRIFTILRLTKNRQVHVEKCPLMKCKFHLNAL